MAYMKDSAGRRLDTFRVADRSRLGLLAFGGLYPIADHALPVGEPDTLSNGTDTAQNVRVRHDLSVRATTVVLMYGNFYNSPLVSGEADGPNDVTVNAGITLPNATGYIPVRFNGLKTVTIKPGTFVLSDPIGVGLLTAGQSMYSQTYATVAAGGKWPLTTVVNNGARPSEGYESGTSITDKSVASGIPANAGRGFGPLAVLGTTPDPAPITAMIGDSIVVGQDDGTGDGIKTLGWANRAFRAQGIPFIKLAASSDKIQLFRDPRRSFNRRMFVPGVANIIEAFGINDVRGGRTLAQLQADKTAFWNECAAQGIDVWAATLTPSTTSTDSWATVANQTVGSWEAVRTGYNDWVRSLPAPLKGVIEVADTVESARNSGKWKVTGSAFGYTPDGLHPNTTGHTAMAGAVTLTPFRA